MICKNLRSKKHNQKSNQKSMWPQPKIFQCIDNLLTDFFNQQYHEQFQLHSVTPPLWYADHQSIQSYSPSFHCQNRQSHNAFPRLCNGLIKKIHHPYIPSFNLFRAPHFSYGVMNRPFLHYRAQAAMRAFKNIHKKTVKISLSIPKSKKVRPKITKDTIYELQLPKLKYSRYVDDQLQKKLLFVGIFRGQFTDSQGDLEFSTSGTAFAIGKNIIITCTHLIYDFQSKRYCKEAFFYLNKKRYKSSANNFYYNIEPTQSMDEVALKEELTIIFLQEEIESTHFLQIGSIEDAASKPKLYLAGFPTDNFEPLKNTNVYYAKMQVLQGHLIEEVYYTFKYDMINTSWGSSGGPIFYINKYGDFVIVGFHTHGRQLQGFNQGIYFNKQVIELIKNQKQKLQKLHSEVFEEDFLNQKQEDQTISQISEYLDFYIEMSQNESLSESDALEIVNEQEKNQYPVFICEKTKDETAKETRKQKFTPSIEGIKYEIEEQTILNNPSLNINCPKAPVIIQKIEVQHHKVQPQFK